MSTRYDAAKGKKKAVVKEAGVVYTVRQAKAQFSELLRLAEQGVDITVTSHGRPKVRITRAGGGAHPFRVARHWLEHMKVTEPQTPAERIIREDRDARG